MYEDWDQLMKSEPGVDRSRTTADGTARCEETDQGIDAPMQGVSARQNAYQPQTRPPLAEPSSSAGKADIKDGALSASEDTKLQQESSVSSAQHPESHREAGSLGRGMACIFCRRRKLRCSGDRPICANCIKYSRQCEYGPARKSPKVQALESKIAQLSSHIHHASFAHQHLPSSFESQSPKTETLTQVEPTKAEPLSLTYNHQPGLDGGFNFPTSRSIAEGYDLHPFSSLPGLASSEMNGDEYLDFSGDDFQGTRVEQDEQYSHLDTGSFARNSSHGWASWVQPDPAMSIFPLLNDGPTPPDTNVLANASSSALAAEIKLDRTELGTFPSYPSVSSDGTSELFVPNFGATRGQPHFPSQIPLNFDERQSPLFGSSGSTSENFSPAPVLSSTVDRSNPYITNQPLAYPAATHTEKIRHTAHIDPIDGLTERLGEFLFSPTEESARTEDGWAKKRRGTKGSISRLEVDGEGWLVRNTLESDGLTDDTRNLLIDCFLAHSRLFFEMSIPRFRYRLTLCDRRRPSLALLNAMYLWATRMSNSPQMSSMEQTFFNAAYRQLDISSANGDRLMDCLRAAMLLSAYSYTSGRFHEGWILAGMAVRLVMSTGLHQIKSCIFRLEPPKNIFLRNKIYLLPPPDDALELAERIHTFWSVFAIDRCGAMATGFPCGLREQDITTPFPRPLSDIASCSVTSCDDTTVVDLYRLGYMLPVVDTNYGMWIKAVTVLERAIKLAFVDPEDSSEYTRAWSHYYIASSTNPGTQIPPAWLDQPKYRCPKDYAETKLGLDQLISGMGAEGIFPVDRRRNAELDGSPNPVITSLIIMLHHQFCTISMLLHDINSLDCENKEALNGARKIIALMQLLPPLPLVDVDSFQVVLWSMVAKVFIKEMHRLRLAGDVQGSAAVEEEANVIILEMYRIGAVMQLARTQARAMEELKKQSVSPPFATDPNEAFRASSIY